MRDKQSKDSTQFICYINSIFYIFEYNPHVLSPHNMSYLNTFFTKLSIYFYLPSFIKSYTIKIQTISTALVFTFLTLSLGTAQAQQAKTRVNIVLADVISIESGSAANGGNVDFHYENVNDYNSEKVTTVPNSLIITFTNPFDLKVKANGENFENGSYNIPVNVLTIKRNASSQITGNSSPIILSTQDQVLISGADRGSKLNLDLDYIIPQSRSSSTDILGKPAGTYTQQITYTATAL